MGSGMPSKLWIFYIKQEQIPSPYDASKEGYTVGVLEDNSEAMK